MFFCKMFPQQNSNPIHFPASVAWVESLCDSKTWQTHLKFRSPAQVIRMNQVMTLWQTPDKCLIAQNYVQSLSKKT